MNVGFVGMGKLGLPVALAAESMGHEVHGYDVNPEISKYLSGETPYPHKEEGLQPLLDNHNVKMAKDLGELVLHSDILFVPVQTPHERRFEGIERLPEDREDFDYTFLVDAVKSISEETDRQSKRTTLSVISTCLPGTYESKVKEHVGENIDYVYNPLYIAMGTVVKDYLNPEFVLVGQESEEAADKLEQFYGTLHDKPVFKTDITTAEGIKVFYNTFITAKTLLANSWMQTAHETGMNVDDITKALSLATDRLLSPRYMRGGGADSGGCHPRDLIALSWLGRQIEMKPNWFEMMAQAREQQVEWNAYLIEKERGDSELPVYILGKAFKPETNITTGSHAILLATMLKERGIDVIQYDPHVDQEAPAFEKGIYFVATEHPEFTGWNYPANSVIMDLWRSVEPPEGCKYIPIGKPNAIQDERTES